MGPSNELIGALCPWNEMSSLRHIGGGNNTTALKKLPLFLNGRSVVFDSVKDAIHVATDQSIKATFDPRTTNSQAYRMWELPERRSAAARQEWAPSSAKFDGRTTSGDNSSTVREQIISRTTPDGEPIFLAVTKKWGSSFWQATYIKKQKEFAQDFASCPAAWLFHESIDEDPNLLFKQFSPDAVREAKE